EYLQCSAAAWPDVRQWSVCNSGRSAWERRSRGGNARSGACGDAVLPAGPHHRA
ncbi:hypothetical protein FOZ62_016397, partial [Perkinsus olseni]